MLAAVALAAALAGQASAPAAAAASLLSDFRSLCMAHPGDVAAPIAMADGLGWSPAPASAMAQLPGVVRGAQGRVMLGADGVEFVVTGQGEVPLASGRARGAVCMVGARPADAGALTARAAAFLRVAPQKGPQGRTVFAYVDGPEGRRTVSLDDEAAALADLKRPGAAVVLVDGIEGGALLAYGVPTP